MFLADISNKEKPEEDSKRIAVKTLVKSVESKFTPKATFVFVIVTAKIFTLDELDDTFKEIADKV